MVRIYRPPIQIHPYSVTSRLFTLDKRVVICLADCLDVLDVEEHFVGAFVRLLVVRDGRPWVMPVALYAKTAAALTRVEVPDERFLPDPVRTAPSRIVVEFATLQGFWRAGVMAPLACKRHL